MVKRRAQRAGWVFAGASALLHVASYLLLRATPPLPPAPLPTTIEWSVMTSPPAAEPAQPAQPEPAEPQPSAAEPPQREEPRRERPVVAEARKPRDVTPPQAESAPAPSAAPGQQPEPVAEAAPSAPAVAVPAAPSAPSTLDLSPRRAASTLLSAQPEFARACSPNAGVASAPACEPADRGNAEVAQRKLNQWLSHAANAPEYRKKREPPALQRQADGSYRFTGHVFTARIRPDGQVDFRDHGDATIDGPATIGPGVMGSFDLTDAVEHGVLGRERYSAEKRWFLEETASLREKLTEAARAEESVNARRALSTALDRILAAAELAPAQKRQQILELWEDCGDDAESRETRRTVEEFVRVRMPQGGPLGFTPEELERFNRGRSGMAAFDPYRKG